MRSRGAECADRPRPFAGVDAAEGIDLASDGGGKGQKRLTGFHSVSALTEAAVLGQRPFWAKGYCVDTVGLDVSMIRTYVKYQEKQERQQQRLKLD